MNVADLHLNLNDEHFETLDRSKTFEYRLVEKWLKLLENKSFGRILFKREFPKQSNTSKIIERPGAVMSGKPSCTHNSEMRLESKPCLK